MSKFFKQNNHFTWLLKTVMSFETVRLISKTRDPNVMENISMISKQEFKTSSF